MKRTLGLSYYVNLTITKVCVRYYSTLSTGLLTSKMHYIGLYISGNASFEPIKGITTAIVSELGNVFGFNIDKAYNYVVEYFKNKVYERYLPYVTLMVK